MDTMSSEIDDMIDLLNKKKSLGDFLLFVVRLTKDNFTGRLILDFHEGNLSHKIKKEVAVNL